MLYLEVLPSLSESALGMGGLFDEDCLLLARRKGRLADALNSRLKRGVLVETTIWMQAVHQRRAESTGENPNQ